MSSISIQYLIFCFKVLDALEIQFGVGE